MSLKGSRNGVSLPEVVICSVLVGVMVVASMNTLTATHLTYRLAAEESAGPGLAQELLSEVLAQAYKEPGSDSAPIGPDNAEPTRRFYDDVDDYHGYSSVPTDRNGAEREGLAEWTRAVEVVYLSPNLNGANSDQGVKRVTVTVTSPTDEVTTLSAIRSEHGALEQSVGVDTEAVVWVGATLQAGEATTPERTGVALPNLVPDPNAD